MIKKAASLILCAVILINLCACGFSGEETVNITAMNTLITIRVFGNSREENERAIALFKEKITEFENLFDANVKTSDVAIINSSKIGAEVEESTAQIIKKSLKASEMTNGAFDITIMPVLKLWGFDNGKYGVPSEDEIKSSLANVGYNRISVSGNLVIKEENTEISLGAIAKGYLGDELLKIATENRVNAIISLGGNIVLCGDNNGKDSWTVGVKNPHGSESLACSFDCFGDVSVVTSGAYERYFEKNGKTYHHIIDTKSGKPAESDLLSVTVIGKDGAMCDAFSTALFALGYKKAVAFAKENNDFSYVFITDKNEITAIGIENLSVDDTFIKV